MQLAASVDVTPANKLTVLRQVGHGGFGDVFKARHSDWSEVAYKKLQITFIRQDERSVIIQYYRVGQKKPGPFLIDDNFATVNGRKRMICQKFALIFINLCTSHS